MILRLSTIGSTHPATLFDDEHNQILGRDLSETALVERMRHVDGFRHSGCVVLTVFFAAEGEGFSGGRAGNETGASKGKPAVNTLLRVDVDCTQTSGSGINSIG